MKKLVTGLNQRRELVNKANLLPHPNFEFLKCCFEPGIIELPLWIARSLSQLHSLGGQVYFRTPGHPLGQLAKKSAASNLRKEKATLASLAFDKGIDA